MRWRSGWFSGLFAPTIGKGSPVFSGAVRFITAGAIVAFAVPLFLSVAKSSLIADLLGKATSDQFFPNALVLIGFCVVAGFASRRFMNSLAARVMQMERKTEKAQETSEKAQQTSDEETSEKAQETSEKALKRIRRRRSRRLRPSMKVSAGPWPTSGMMMVVTKPQPQ